MAIAPICKLSYKHQNVPCAPCRHTWGGGQMYSSTHS